MTRFTDIDLARLPARPKTALAESEYYSAYMADLAARMNAVDIPYDVGGLATDTYAITGGAFAYRTTLVATALDDAVSAVLLPWSYGANLDGLGATQRPPVQRNPLVPDPRPYDAFPEDWEKDESFKARIQQAPEALSTCGPEGAYLWFTLAVPGVHAASAYGPMSYGGNKAAPFTGLGEVHIPVVSESGDGAALESLIAAVQAAVSADERRPIADFVTVTAATILPYTINATLQIGTGADSSIVLMQGYTRLRALADYQYRPGGMVKAKALYAAAYVPDATGTPIVGDVDLNGFIDVNAIPITPATPAGAYVAPYCAPPEGDPVITSGDGIYKLTAGGITVTVEVVDD